MSRAAAWTIIIIILLVVAAVVYWIYAGNMAFNQPASQEGNQQKNTIQTNSTASLGTFLTDGKGRTLYYFVSDVVGKSNCTGQCLLAWPQFYADNITVSSDLNAGDFGQITTEAGVKQTTYKGWPLYYYSNDKNPGDANGQGLQNAWFVATNPFYNVMLLGNEKSGFYLADSKGFALYYSKADTKGTDAVDPKSACKEQCLGVWPIFDQSKIVAPSALKLSDFKEFTRPDGQTQLSYKGYPLYIYSKDASSGDTKGDKQNNSWYLVKP